MAKIAGRAVESLLSFLGSKKPKAQPCIEYKGNSDGWLPVYLDGVQVMFHDSDQSAPIPSWKADKIELERIKSDIAEREGIHIRYTTEIEAAWPDLTAVVRWGERVQAEPRGAWLFMKGPQGPVPKSLWPKARQFWEDIFQNDGIESPGRRRDKSPDDEVKVTLDSRSKEPLTTDEIRSRFESLESQRSNVASSSYGPIKHQQGPTRSSFAYEESLESTTRPLAPSDEDEWQDLSPSSRPKVKPPVLQPRLEIPNKESAKAVELGTTDEHQSAEQDGTKLIPQPTQLTLDGKRVQSPREVAQRVASIEDASSEMTAMASGPRPIEAPASSAVNHRGVTSLSPVSSKRVWMAGSSPFYPG